MAGSGCSRHLTEVDPEMADIVSRELHRQSTQLGLIASENFASHAVLEAESSVLTNKYAEGLPGQRYYHGCKHVDSAEQLAIDRAKEVFGSEHANVQPHSGNQANMAAYCALLDPGDTIMSMDLSHGGHLSHGSPANFSGVQYRIVSYGVDRASETIDYDQAAQLALEHKPRLVIAGSSSYPRVIDFARFRAIADTVGAYLMVDMAHIAGLVAAGVHPSPVPVSDVVTTTTHKTLRGPTGGMILCRQEHADAIDRMVFPGIQGGPLMHTIAAKAVALKEALAPEFRVYQQAVVDNARALADELGRRGYRTVSGGTDTHIVLLDLASHSLLGQQAADALEAADIVVSKSPVPFGDKRLSRWSGIRLGTPKLTTRGMDTSAMIQVASLIDRVLTNTEDETERAAVQDGVRELCERFPLPYDR